MTDKKERLKDFENLEVIFRGSDNFRVPAENFLGIPKRLEGSEKFLQ